MTTEEKSAYWRQHVESWKNSGLSQRDYCNQNALAFSSFGYWRNRLKTDGAVGKLIPINVSRSAAITVYLPCGVRIETPLHGLAEILPLLTGGDHR